MKITKKNLDIISLFSGCGGLDLGFKNAGFNIPWANEFDKDIWETFEQNHPSSILDRRSITEIPSTDIPSCLGVIGGPPCQSWSEAGALRGIKDKRGQLFFDFIRILKEKQPIFFLAENVSGMLFKRHSNAVQNILHLFNEAGFNVSYEILNASDYLVPQDRKRIFFVGFNKNLTKRKFIFPQPFTQKKVLKDAIWDIKDTAIPASEKNRSNGNTLKILNHEYMTGGFSTIYMSRNRVRSWDEPSFTIQAGGRHAPLHPRAPKMETVEKDKKRFVSGQEHLYRRLSVRECARIQTFPDDFKFYYQQIAAAYKMIGNAVPVKLGEILALKIRYDLAMEGILPPPPKNKITLHFSKWRSTTQMNLFD